MKPILFGVVVASCLLGDWSSAAAGKGRVQDGTTPPQSTNQSDTKPKANKPKPEKPKPDKPKPTPGGDEIGGVRRMSGIVTGVSAHSMTVKSAEGKEWTFAIDSKTKITSRTKSASTKASGSDRPTVGLTDWIKSGDQVTVSVDANDAKMRAKAVKVTGGKS